MPAGFSAAGATIEVSIGGVVPAQDANLIVKFAKGSFASSLVDEGLVNATVAGVAVTMPVEIKLNDTMYASAKAQKYNAAAGKTGSAK